MQSISPKSGQLLQARPKSFVVKRLMKGVNKQRNVSELLLKVCSVASLICENHVCVLVPLNISFFGVEEAKHGCLSVDMNAVLLCRAVGTAALSVTILGPQKAVVAKSRPGKQETNYTFTSDFTKKGLYICTASDDGHTAKKMYTVCLTGKVYYCFFTT